MKIILILFLTIILLNSKEINQIFSKSDTLLTYDISNFLMPIIINNHISSNIKVSIKDDKIFIFYHNLYKI